MTAIKKRTWEEFVWVVRFFFGNRKCDGYIQHIERLLKHYHRLGCNMNIKLHYRHRHLDRLPENLGDLTEEQGERFHRDIRTMEEIYQGYWNVYMMAG